MLPAPAFISGIGPGELVLIFLVLLLVFGPRLPEVGRALGLGIKEFKDGLKGESNPGADADGQTDGNTDKDENRPG